MGIDFRINSLTFSDGSEIEINQDEIVLLVGPNNSGKTSCLRELVSKLQTHIGGPVLNHVDYGKSGSPDDLVAWLSENFNPITQGNGQISFLGLGGSIRRANAKNRWNDTDGFKELTPFLVRFLTAEDRLQASKTAPSHTVFKQQPTQPIHALLEDISIEERVSTAFEKAFGISLFLDRWKGNELSLHTGQCPRTSPWTLDQRKEIERIPVIDSQGDGMRSFVGCLMEVQASKQPVLLVDEPEVFLHPPQARLLGRMLALDKPAGRQMVIASHSVDVLRGLLDANTGNLRVVRIRREDNVNRVSELDPAQITTLWADPLLRSSNALDAVFHEAAVVCEGDSDCRFFQAVLDAILDGAPDEKRPDLMFFHCGGKDRMSTIVHAFSQIDVPVKAIADFDLLATKDVLKRLGEAIGIVWADIEGDWKPINDTLKQMKPSLSLAQVKQKVGEILDRDPGPELSNDATKEIRKTLKTISPWAQAKSSGRAAIPSGQPTNHLDALVRNLNEAGLFLVEEGELERLCPSIGGHGPRWVNEVLQKDLAKDPELEVARSFVRKVILS